MKSEVIYGPPGTGKTTRLMQKVTEEKGGQLLVSHTKVAAAEMKNRLESCGFRGAIMTGTIHSVAFKALDLDRSQVVSHEKLQDFGDGIGVRFSGATGVAMEEVQEVTVGDEILAIYNLARSLGCDPIIAYMNSHRPGSREEFESIVGSYAGWKKIYGFADFTDMLEWFVKEQPRVPSDQLVIDEAQDLSPLQWKAMNLLADQAGKVVLAGDDDQCLFKWGGADPAGMARFEQKHGSVRTILTQSYRLPYKIHGLATSVIGKIRERVEKRFNPRNEPGVLSTTNSLMGVRISPRRRTLILFRNHSVGVKIEADLQRAGVPYHSSTGKAPLQSKLSRAAVIWEKFRDTGETSPDQWRLVTEMAHTNLLDNLNRYRGMSWDKILRGRPSTVQYLKTVPPGTQTETILSSIHTAKGMEADDVILCTAMAKRTADGIAADPDSETRVFYVGITRAKERLTLVMDHTYGALYPL